MASPAASSPSEGEIVEMKQDKATTAQTKELNLSIDRTNRDRHPKVYDDSSRSGSPASQPRRRRSSRSRSRSPYRRPVSPRGEKRRHDDDYSRDRDWPEARRTKHHHNDDSRHHRDGRRDYERSEGRPRYDDRKPRKNNRNRDRRDRSRSRSRDRSRSPWSRRKAEARTKDEQPKTFDKHSSFEKSFVKEQWNANTKDAKPFKAQSELASRSAKVSFAAESAQEEQPAPEPVVDEAAQIEERRKRREVLKAKFKNQPTPLLTQVLNGSTTSNPATPATSTPGLSRSASPSLDSPRSQGAEDVFEVGNDSDLANPAPLNGQQDGPSAADYDPTADMQNDRAKHDHRMQDMPTVEYVETQESHDIMMPHDQMTELKAKEEFDMFADDDDDDDDDDMFAPELNKPKEKASKAKQLDAKLLDDWDDHEGYYRIILGELLDGRYHVQAVLGKGMFSAVVRAQDNKSNKAVAIKIIRNNESMRKAAIKEIDILQQLIAADPEDKKHLIRMERSFEHKNHMCMVFENLSINLREVLKKFGRDVGINLRAIRTYAHQMFLALKLLKTCGIIHADIKPDNMLVNEARNNLKVCDLGSAGSATDAEITPYLVSRFYRAPEIILGMEFDYGIDTWSVGCTLYELYTSKILFVGRDNNQMLKSIMECRGRFSLKMLKKAQLAGDHFDQNLMFRSRETDKVTGKEATRLLNLVKPTRDLKTKLLGAAKGLGETDLKELNLFVDFLDRCLTLNPEKRITPADALNHPFINRRKAL